MAEAQGAEAQGTDTFPCLPPEAPKRETVSWCVERADTGRGFGIVMPHFIKSWQQEEDLRRLILNGIIWTAKLEVPTKGVQTTLPDLATFEPKRKG